MSNNNQRNRPDNATPEGVAASNPLVGNLSREQVAHGEARKPRVPMDAGDYNLSVPEGTIPKDRVGHWFLEDDAGRISRAKAAYWEPVTDSFGNNITRPSGSGRMHLMSIEKIYYDEDQELMMNRYRASMGERDNKPLEGGVESYVPSGHTNSIKVNSDPFSS